MAVSIPKPDNMVPKGTKFMTVTVYSFYDEIREFYVGWSYES